MELNVVNDDGQAAAVACTGDIVEPDVRNRDPFQELLGQTAYGRCLLLDLTGVGHIDSSGIGWLILANRRFQAEGGRLILHSLSPAIRNLIESLRIESILQIAGDEPQARSLAAEKPP